MRSEQEMLDLILGVARQDERIRAVWMNGSRANPRAPRDIFQDYDIAYLVDDMSSFLKDHSWVDVFGERLIMQMPEEMTLVPPELEGWFAYLMLFTDGNRIDLTLVPLKLKDKHFGSDKLTVVLLDKDSSLPPLPSPTDEDYWVRPPSAQLFADCCNEFWWVSTYVAKGLWRQEIIYAKAHLDQHVRPMLIKMLEWRVGIKTGFALSTGKFGKYLEKYLPKEDWQALMSTYASGSYDDTWRALLAACRLFRRIAQIVAVHFGYLYPLTDDERVYAYLQHVRELPRDAAGIY